MRIWLFQLLVTSVACSNNWDALDPRLGESSPTTSGTGASAGNGGAGGGGAPTDGGSGGVPLPEPPLVGEPLARYYLDEASEGTSPRFALDSASPPLDLGMQYNGPVSYTQVDQHRGITWPSIGQNGGPAANVGGTKVYNLDGSTTGTIEVVLSLIDSSVNGSRIVHIGTDDEAGRFTLFSNAPDRLAFTWQPNGAMIDVVGGEWAVDLPSLGRIVLHLVLDTNLGTPEERLRLFVNGAPVDAVDGTLPTGGEVVDFELNNRLALGNRADGGRSFQGSIFYAALYQSALTDAEVDTNARVLLDIDDHP